MTPSPNRPGAGRLILCFGNPAREDDGIGPAIAERLEELSLAGVRVESNYQLCVEDALAAAESGLVVFVDAAESGPEPYSLERVQPREGADYTTHSLGPDQLLGLARLDFGRSPEAYLLAVRGYSFGWFVEGLTERAEANLEAALDFLVDFLRGSADGAPGLTRAHPKTHLGEQLNRAESSGGAPQREGDRAISGGDMARGGTG